MIYTAAYTPSPGSHHTSLAPNPTTPPRWLPSICALNHTTYLDAGLWFTSTTTFTIPLPSASQTLTHFSTFLSTFPGTSGFDAIRRLGVSYFDLDLRTHDRRERAALWDFLGKCASVRELTLQFRVMNLLQANVSCYDVVMTNLSQEEVDGVTYLRALGDVIEACGVDRLFEVELGGLRTVVLEVWPTMLADGMGGGVGLTAMPLIEELAEYLREGFRMRGREVDVAIRGSFTLGVQQGEN